ncbi:hypothetical protein [Streptomyces massasporeus]|nr:hypothetical protein [Streptomyces massasporeus]
MRSHSAACGWKTELCSTAQPTLPRRPSRDVLLSGELRDEAWARRRPG